MFLTEGTHSGELLLLAQNLPTNAGSTWGDARRESTLLYTGRQTAGLADTYPVGPMPGFSCSITSAPRAARLEPHL
jgi:hypothetical protein